jgi:hypothetical protein
VVCGVGNGVKCFKIEPSFDFIQAFVIGHKGQRGILKIPTRQGYVHDKYGLSCNLMAIRFNDKKPIFWGVNLYYINIPLLAIT